jgi:hypothetical protein
MLDSSKVQSVRLANKINHLERYTYFKAEAPEEIERLVQDIIMKVRSTKIFSLTKAIAKGTRENYEKAEGELMDFVDDKCRHIAMRITQII